MHASQGKENEGHACIRLELLLHTWKRWIEIGLNRKENGGKRQSPILRKKIFSHRCGIFMFMSLPHVNLARLTKDAHVDVKKEGEIVIDLRRLRLLVCLGRHYVSVHHAYVLFRL